ncbi:hypothetical protein [Aquisphaera insulae]|nr:hypothetical protein [Aquisphaera insulae]
MPDRRFPEQISDGEELLETSLGVTDKSSPRAPAANARALGLSHSQGG